MGTDISKLASIYGQIRLYGLSEVKRIRKALYEATGAYGSAQAGDDL